MIFRQACQLLGPNRTLIFDGVDQFRAKLEQISVRLVHGVRIVVERVSEETLDQALRTCIVFSPAKRVWIDRSMNSAIITLEPHIVHESISRALIIEILIRISEVPGHTYQTVFGCGATRFGSPRVRSKEGDQGIKDVNRLGGPPNIWPNLMCEIGYEESLPQLRLDAKWWLVASSGQTKMVLLVHATGHLSSLRLEQWEIGPSPPRAPHHSPVIIPLCTNVLDIDAAGTVTPAGARLTIPYRSLFDNPHPNQRDIILTSQHLTKLALYLSPGFF